VFIVLNEINFYSVLQSTIKNLEKKIFERKKKEQIVVNLTLTVLVKVNKKCPPKIILHEF